jgi:hypothetical protein
MGSPGRRRQQTGVAGEVADLGVDLRECRFHAAVSTFPDPVFHRSQ